MVGVPIDVFTTTTSAFDSGDVAPSQLAVAVRTWVPSASFAGTRQDQVFAETSFTVQTTAPPVSRTTIVTASWWSSSSSSSPSPPFDVPVRTGNASFVGEALWSIVGAATPRVRTTKLMPADEMPPATAVHV